MKLDLVMTTFQFGWQDLDHFTVRTPDTTGPPFPPGFALSWLSPGLSMSSLQGYVDRESPSISSFCILTVYPTQRPRTPRSPRWTFHSRTRSSVFFPLILTFITPQGRALRLRPKVQRRPLRFERARLQHGRGRRGDPSWSLPCQG